MAGKKSKGYFGKHAKSSAALVSLGIHAVLILVAVSFVAVQVIVKEDQVFEAKPVKRPKMQLKKLQVPVNIKKKKTQKPKLRKRIVVQPKLNQTIPDIKMPEMTGVKGGMGNAAGTGLGGSGGVGFSMPEINMFGVKSKGEKIFIILDSSADMMHDSRGGMTAYTLIKDELAKILGGLNPTVLFNVAVYGKTDIYTLFPSMAPASAANVEKVKVWLDPLNQVTKGMGDRDYGTKTLGKGGSKASSKLATDPLKTTYFWTGPSLLSMKQGADAIFLLTAGWARPVHETSAGKSWTAEQWKEWEGVVAKAQKKLNAENAARRKKGQPPKVVGSKRTMVRIYEPNAKFPPAGNVHHYSPKEVQQAMETLHEDSAPRISLTKSGVAKRKKGGYEFNVIHFVPRGAGKDGKFQQLAKSANGNYRTLAGLDEIRSSIPSHIE